MGQKEKVKSILETVLLGKTMSKVAQQIGVSPSTLSSWRRGKTLPKPEQWSKLCVVLAISHGGVFTPENTSYDENFTSENEAAVSMDVGVGELRAMAKEEVIHPMNKGQLVDRREVNMLLGHASEDGFVAVFPEVEDDVDRNTDEIIKRMEGKCKD